MHPTLLLNDRACAIAILDTIYIVDG